MLDTAPYKERLTTALARVTEELKTLGVHDPKNKRDWLATPEEEVAEADPNTAADRSEEWGERAATLAALEREYNDLTRALANIENGAYGVCEISGEAIEPDRLDANPAARTCKTHLDEEAELPQ